MRLVVSLAGIAAVAVFALVGAALWDLGWNGGALLDRLSGRGAMEQACLPALTRRLSGLGFSPVDVSLGQEAARSSMFAIFGGHRRLTGGFVFFDGPDGPRIDGTFSCEHQGTTTTIDVETDAHPRRVT